MYPHEKFIDRGGRYLTQSLFLELGYNDFAIYSLKEMDHTYNGVVYPSLKRLYLETEDTTEYQFASTYLAGWRHWEKICANKMIFEYISEWREELELKLRARAAKQMMHLAEEGSYQASKWLADRGWDTRAAGRPSKIEKEGHKAAISRIGGEYEADVVRLLKVK